MYLTLLFQNENMIDIFTNHTLVNQTKLDNLKKDKVWLWKILINQSHQAMIIGIEELRTLKRPNQDLTREDKIRE